MTMKQLKTENAVLRTMLTDLQIMAKRYADGRMSMACSTVNSHTQTMLDFGITVNPGAEQIIWALDGSGRIFDGLTEAQVTPGTPEAMGVTK